MRALLLAPLILLLACVPDADGDGFKASEDCDDGDAAVHPDADELCNGIDDDCDGTVDEAAAVDARGWSADVDGDGYGGEASFTACEAPPGYLADDSDCNDRDADAFPGAEERCNQADDDCDGLVDEDPVDGTTYWADADGDGYGDAEAPLVACTQPLTHVENSLDCDDADGDVYPEAQEWCNGVDDDCDDVVDEDDAMDAPEWHADQDEDGYGSSYHSIAACEAPGEAWLLDGSDCNDDDASVNPGAAEVFYDGEDSDCDGHSDYDADFDGYDSAEWGGEDCDDTDAALSPDATEVADLVDNDCDGACDEGFVPAGALVITELMVDPDAVYDSLGEWVELTNVSGVDVTMCSGWTLSDDGKDEHTLALGIVLAADELLVLAREDDSTLNGGVTADYEYSNFQLMNDGDTVYLSHDGAVIDEVSYDSDWSEAITTGASAQLDAHSYDATSNDSAESWCPSTTAMSEGDHGTPGVDNEPCAAE